MADGQLHPGVSSLVLADGEDVVRNARRRHAVVQVLVGVDDYVSHRQGPRLRLQRVRCMGYMGYDCITPLWW